jgi:hypothetical protein
MVAKVSTGRSIRGAITYNENKVKKDAAEFLAARKFIKDKHDLSFEDKVKQFKRYTEQNSRAKVNSYHYSLNFHEDDKLDNDQMIKIADKFMKDIRFGNQPYLVYRHHDSGHPHIHIVSTNIQANGKRINDSWNARLMRNSAEEVERDYGLTLTGKNLRMLGQKYQYPDHDKQLSAVEYPEQTLRNKISDVVAVIHYEYKYKSFEDYNELLSTYNLKAIRLNGRNIKQDDIQTNGLAFQTMKNGKETGVPIYASEILHLGKFNIREVEIAIRSHKKKKLSDRLESVTSEFLGDLITYRPSSLHQHLQARGFFPLGKKEQLVESNRYLDQESKAVVSLEDIEDPKLRSAMEKKKHRFDMSRGEGEQITHEIKEFYQHIKKQHPDKYFLESRWIADLENVDFKPLKNRLAGKYEPDKIAFNLENFLKYKSDKRKEIQNREKIFFKDQAAGAFVYTNHLTKNDRQKILAAMKVKPDPLGQIIIFQHIEYPELKAHSAFELEEIDTSGKKDMVKGEIKYADLQMLKDYFTGKKSTQGIDSAVDTALKYRRFPEAYRLLREKDKLDFQRRFTTRYLDMQHWDESLKPKQLLGELAAKGIVVKFDVNHNAVLGLHGFDKRVFHKAPVALNEYLKAAGYKVSHHAQVLRILEKHTQDISGDAPGPMSVVLLKDKSLVNDKEHIIKMVSNLTSITRTTQQEPGIKDAYGEATHMIGKKKKRKKRKLL